jgi:hypothetical protein
LGSRRAFTIRAAWRWMGTTTSSLMTRSTTAFARSARTFCWARALAGSLTADWRDGQGTPNFFYSMHYAAVDGDGNIIVADKLNRIRKISPDGNVRSARTAM